MRDRGCSEIRTDRAAFGAAFGAEIARTLLAAAGDE
jgi:hypothetical protein